VHPSEQGQFNFGASHTQDGYSSWLQQRRDAVRQLARKMGLPLDRRVEVWLRNDIRLVGTLRLREEGLFLPENDAGQPELVVDGVPFTPGEMLSCVALDSA
jgi:hypothetical protein